MVKWISLSARPSRTDRWLSGRFDNYLSSRCLIGHDYTLLEERVKQDVSRIIGHHLTACLIINFIFFMDLSPPFHSGMLCDRLKFKHK